MKAAILALTTVFYWFSIAAAAAIRQFDSCFGLTYIEIPSAIEADYSVRLPPCRC